jgi:hypothetical protein
MAKSDSNNLHITIVAPLPEDYETAKALLDEPKPEYHLTHSGAACSRGKVGPHNVVLVGKAEDMLNVSAFVKDTVDDLLEDFPSIRAGFLIGIDGTAPEESLAKPGDIVVGFPQGFQPGLVQFDVDETTISNRISTTFEMSHPPFCIKSVINTIQSPAGRRHWGEYLQHQSSRAELASTKDCQPLKQDPSKPNKILRGKVASSARLLSDRDLTNKVGSDSKIMCFERAAACIKSRLPFLTLCGTVSSASSSSSKLDEYAARQIRMATIIYAMFVSHRISTVQLEEEHAFTDLFQYDRFGLDRPGFRLIRLEKGVQSQLKCHLVQAYLDKELIFTYEALSYSWGSQNTPHEIIIDGKPLSITESLHEALCSLRNPTKDRMLWVDALCIDQSNIKERGHQVDCMGEIYKKADNVIIWLGYVSGAGAVMLKFAIDIFKDELPLHAFRKWSRQDTRWQHQWKQSEASVGLSSHDSVDGLQSFMGKPWFSRVWILQEVANAKCATVECNLGSIPAKIFALLPHAMNFQVGEQCQAVLDIMPSPLKGSSWWDQNRNLCNLMWKFRGCQATDPRDRVYALLGMASDMKDTEMRADYAKDERAVIQDFCGYLLGDVCPAYDSLATDIRDLQAQLPAISMQQLQQKLKGKSRNSSLRAYLGRQGLIAMIDDQHFVDIMRHGSRTMSLFLDKSESPVRITSDIALQSLHRYPDALEALLKRPDFIIEPLPEFVARAMEYDPEVLDRLLGSSSNPEQLRDDALMEAMLIGLPSCQTFLEYCHPPVKITAKLLRKAMVCHRDVLQYLLSVARSPVQLLENIYLDAITEHPRGIRIIDEHSRPVLMTKGLICKGIEAGEEVLELFLEEMECSIELEEDLFLKAIANGLGTLKCLTRKCINPFNISRKAYREATRAGMETLDHLFPSSPTDPKLTETRVLAFLETVQRYHRWERKINWEYVFLRKDDTEEKLQITSNLILNTVGEDCNETLRRMQYAEQDVPEDAAIRAIESGPEAFTTLLNRPGLNFRVTERIRQAASEHMYAFEVLRVKRQSEVFPGSNINPDRYSVDLMEKKLEAAGWWDYDITKIRLSEIFNSI